MILLRQEKQMKHLIILTDEKQLERARRKLNRLASRFA
jgi:hypothetical protein